MLGRFRDRWADFDPEATSFIKIGDLREFLKVLESPLGFSQTLINDVFLQDKFIAQLALPTYNNFSSYQFMDVLDALSLRTMVIEQLKHEKIKSLGVQIDHKTTSEQFFEEHGLLENFEEELLM